MAPCHSSGTGGTHPPGSRELTSENGRYRATKDRRGVWAAALPAPREPSARSARSSDILTGSVQHSLRGVHRCQAGGPGVELLDRLQQFLRDLADLAPLGAKPARSSSGGGGRLAAAPSVRRPPCWSRDCRSAHARTAIHRPQLLALRHASEVTTVRIHWRASVASADGGARDRSRAAPSRHRRGRTAS